MLSTGTTSHAAPTAGTYSIDPLRSTVSYSSRHMFGLGTVHASFTVTSGTVSVAEPLDGSRVEASIDAGSFHSDSAKRDRDVTSDRLLDAATYPEITFSSTGLRRHGDGFLVDGTVTCHGAAVNVELTVTEALTEADGIRFRARAEHLDRRAWGITQAKGFVGRFLDLDVDVLAVPVSAGAEGSPSPSR